MWNSSDSSLKILPELWFADVFVKANSMGSICTYYIDEEDNTLSVYSFIRLAELLTERDIGASLETFQNEAFSTLDGSGLITFCE
ncbi:MAG: hypothetical protein GY801_04285 [bacterium]|nr:hypothetical protein [bacterium]